MVNTKVRQLTAMNIQALATALPEVTTAVTYATFHCSPATALSRLERAMSELGARGTTYRSLQTVRRKLTAAAPRYNSEDLWKSPKVSLTPHVDVIR